MKNLTIPILILLLMIAAVFTGSKASAQDKILTTTGKGYTAIYFSRYKIHVPNSTKNYLSNSLDDNKRVALLVKDTLWINKPDSDKIIEQSHELRYLRWRGRTYRYQHAFYDKAYFWTQHKKGKEIY